MDVMGIIMLAFLLIFVFLLFYFVPVVWKTVESCEWGDPATGIPVISPDAPGGSNIDVSVTLGNRGNFIHIGEGCPEFPVEGSKGGGGKEAKECE